MRTKQDLRSWGSLSRWSRLADWQGFPCAPQPQRVYVWVIHSVLTHRVLRSLIWFLFNTTCGSSYCLLKTRPNPPNAFHEGHQNNLFGNNFWVATEPGHAHGGEVEMKGPVFHYCSPKRAAPWGNYFLLKMKMYHLSLNTYCLSGANKLAFNDSVSLGIGTCVRKVDRIIGISSRPGWNPAVSQ